MLECAALTNLVVDCSGYSNKTLIIKESIMKAAVIRGTQKIVVEDIPTPEPGSNQVLIKIKYSASVSYTHLTLPTNREV